MTESANEVLFFVALGLFIALLAVLGVLLIRLIRSGDDLADRLLGWISTRDGTLARITNVVGTIFNWLIGLGVLVAFAIAAPRFWENRYQLWDRFDEGDCYFIVFENGKAAASITKVLGKTNTEYLLRDLGKKEIYTLPKLAFDENEKKLHVRYQGTKCVE